MFAVAAVVSATTVACASVESYRNTRWAMRSFTSTPPSGITSADAILASESVVTCSRRPICRTGGGAWAPSAAPAKATAAVMSILITPSMDSRPLEVHTPGAILERHVEYAIPEPGDLAKRGQLHAIDERTAPVHHVVDRSAVDDGRRADPHVALAVGMDGEIGERRQIIGQFRGRLGQRDRRNRFRAAASTARAP